jgi:hypothetical protein
MLLLVIYTAVLHPNGIQRGSRGAAQARLGAKFNIRQMDEIHSVDVVILKHRRELIYIFNRNKSKVKLDVTIIN